MELCVGISVLALMGGLTAYVHSHLLDHLRQNKEDIQMLFLARSVLEEFKAFGKAGSHKALYSSSKDYPISLHRKKGVIAGYEEVTVTISRVKRAGDRGKKAITLSTGIFHDDV